jgi:hypothetical protein
MEFLYIYIRPNQEQWQKMIGPLAGISPAVLQFQFNAISLFHAAIFGWLFSRSLRDKST